MDINSIAKLAGVSRATVSRYLNDGYVSAEKRKVIARVIKETGYVPSQQAQTLRTGKTNIVGVILPKVNSHAVSRMLSGMTLEFNDAHYQTLLANTNNNKETEVSYLQLFAEGNQVDGIILIATVLDQEHRRALDALRVPVVILGQDMQGYSSVFNDDYRSMLQLCRKVLQNSAHPAYIGVTQEEAGLAWLIRSPYVTCPIIGASEASQIESSCKALDVKMTAEVLKQLDSIFPPVGEAPEAYAW